MVANHRTKFWDDPPSSLTMPFLRLRPVPALLVVNGVMSFKALSKIEDWVHIPIASMYGLFTYIYHTFKPYVGKDSIHGWYGMYFYLWFVFDFWCCFNGLYHGKSPCLGPLGEYVFVFFPTSFSKSKYIVAEVDSIYQCIGLLNKYYYC